MPTDIHPEGVPPSDPRPQNPTRRKQANRRLRHTKRAEPNRRELEPWERGLVERAQAPGAFHLNGALVPMICGRVGPHGCEFQTDAASAPEAGVEVHVSVPGDPVSDTMITVVGTVVAKLTATATSVVAVECHRGSLPNAYRALVRHWASRA